MLHISLVVGRILAKNINLHLVKYLVKWHQKMLHFMKCFPDRMRQAHTGSICTSLQERDFQPFKYQCLEMAGGRPKYSASMTCPKTLWLGGDPTKVLWAFGILWSEKMGEDSHFCIGPAPDTQAKLSALWALLLWPPTCCRWGGNVPHSSDLGWLESPPWGCLLCSWVKYWLVIAHSFCNSNCFHACLKIHLNEAQINLMT